MCILLIKKNKLSKQNQCFDVERLFANLHTINDISKISINSLSVNSIRFVLFLVYLCLNLSKKYMH